MKISSQLIKCGIQIISKNAFRSHHITMHDAADRPYIHSYVSSCIQFLPPCPSIMEFDGGVVYANEIIEKIGGEVDYVTKRGRDDRHNVIRWEFDIEQEIVQKKYDVIIATQVLGSFVNPIDITQKLKSMLKPQGVLVLTVSGPAYPRIRGLVSFFSKEGLVKIGQAVFGAKNVKNVRAYGNLASAICMLDYFENGICSNYSLDDDMQHEVINGIVCVNS